MKNNKAQHIQPKSENQDLLLRSIREKTRLVVTTGPAGVGKAQPLTSKVLTPSGFVTMGSLKVGDTVTGSDGGQQTVTGVFPQGVRDVYRITSHDGRVVEADAEHLWQIENHNWKKSRVVTTLKLKELVEAGPRYPIGIQMFEGVIDDEEQPDVDPYLFGYALGSKQYVYGGRVWPSYLPEEYIQRWPNAVLTGLFDGGARIRENRSIEFSNCRGRLSEQVVELVRRVGGLAKVSEKNMNVRLPNPQDYFRTFTARRALSGLNRNRLRVRIESVEFDRKDKTQCISVSNEDRLYVTDEYVVTHNTYCAVNAAVNEVFKGNYDKVVLTRPNVSTGRSLGYFPGTVEEKLEPWLQPMLSEFRRRLGKGEYEVARKRWIQIQPFEVIRGASFLYSLILVDEAQNLTREELKAITTRIGEGSKMILMGDPLQKDTKDSALREFSQLLNSVEDSAVITFGEDDIVRSDITAQLVKLFLRTPGWH